MDKLRATCVQANASILIGTIETIFQIPLDRTSHLRQLTADLMVPPRLQIDLQQIIIIRMGDQFITQDGFLGIRPLGIVSVTLILLLVPHQPIHQLTLILRGTVLDDRPIRLAHLTDTKHLVQAREGLARLGENHDPAHRTIQTVRDTDKDIPGLAILLLQPYLQHLRERLIARLVALHDLTAGLIYRYNMIILVNNLHITCSYRRQPE